MIYLTFKQIEAALESFYSNPAIPHETLLEDLAALKEKIEFYEDAVSLN